MHSNLLSVVEIENEERVYNCCSSDTTNDLRKWSGYPSKTFWGNKQ
nr:MAG TPA: hypothetical protein [Caudoviricetes sp.]